MPIRLPNPRVELDVGPPAITGDTATVRIRIILNGSELVVTSATLDANDVAAIYAAPTAPGSTIAESVGAAVLGVLSDKRALFGGSFPADYIQSLGDGAESPAPTPVPAPAPSPAPAPVDGGDGI